jgi:hypothetical protein
MLSLEGVNWRAWEPQVYPNKDAAKRAIRGLKGHESIAQVLACVYISNGTALKLKGRQKIEFRGATGFWCPLQHLQPGGPGVFPTRRYDVTPCEGTT